MYLKYVNGCVMSSPTGLPGSFKPFFFCDVFTWHNYLSAVHAEYIFDDDFDDSDLDDDFPDEPFDYDFDI